LRGCIAIDNSLDESSERLLEGSWSRATVDRVLPPRSRRSDASAGLEFFEWLRKRSFSTESANREPSRVQVDLLQYRRRRNLLTALGDENQLLADSARALTSKLTTELR
jgi:hypothetical protein